MALTNTTATIAARPQFATDFGILNPEVTQATQSLAAGTSASQADLLYQATRTATTSGDSIDLNGGGLLQPDGSAFNAANVVGIFIYNKDASATLTVGGGSNPIANVSMTIKPSGIGALLAPTATAYGVTAGTADILKVVSSAATSSYAIPILARSV